MDAQITGWSGTTASIGIMGNGRLEGKVETRVKVNSRKAHWSSGTGNPTDTKKTRKTGISVADFLFDGIWSQTDRSKKKKKGSYIIRKDRFTNLRQRFQT